MPSLKHSHRNAVVARALVAAACALAVALLGAGQARAVILPAQSLSVPGGNVFENGDVAISEDGTGGAVFIAVTGGRRHVFASLLRDGSWSAPQQVDVGMDFDAFSPRIGAGDGGRLVVIWVERGPADAVAKHDQIYSASLDPGSWDFESPVLVDFDIGAGELAFPDVAMNAVGTAYLVYRNTVAYKNYGTTPSGVSIPDGDALVTTKLARYNGWIWSRLDQVVNRNTAATVRFPAEDNAPKVGISASGTGAVAFQEPDSSGFARVWVRKLFGGAPGLPLLASPTEYGGAPLLTDADAIALTVSRAGAIGVAFRQAAGNQSKLDRARIMTNRIADPGDIFSVANTFAGVKLADSLGGGGVPGRPSLRMKKDAEYELAYTLDGSAFTQRSTAQTEYAPERMYDAAGGAAQDVYSSLADDDSLVQASVAGSSIRVVDAASRAAAYASAPNGTEVSDLRFAANNSGDAAVAAIQETPGGRRIVVDTVDSPPDPFQINVPEGWVRTRRPGITWVRLTDGSGPLRYEVRVDGRLRASTFGDSASLGKVKDGRRKVSITAIDAVGQALLNPTFTYRVDRRKPSVSIRRVRGGRVRVTLDDGTKRRSSGISSRSRVWWGDGSSSSIRKGAATHRFRRRSGIRLVVKAGDKAGNKLTVRRRIRL